MSDRARKSDELRRTLARPEIHDAWEQAYRTPENSPFYDKAIARIAERAGLRPGETLLDAGCGICDYSIRLARRGLTVKAVDFSESVIPTARANVERHGLTIRISVERADITGLDFADASVDHALCWGVLMHIAEIERAIHELSRVVRPGGCVIVSECNCESFEARATRLFHRLRGKPSGTRTPAGYEHWISTEAGVLLQRDADQSWLARQFAQEGLAQEDRFAARFSGLYMRAPNRALARLVHQWNALWFRFGRPGPALGNFTIFRKPGAS